MNGLSMNRNHFIKYRPIFVVTCLIFHGWTSWLSVPVASAKVSFKNSGFGRTNNASHGVSPHVLSLSNGLTGELLAIDDEGFVLITGEGELAARDFTVASASFHRERDAQILDVLHQHAGWQGELQFRLLDGLSFGIRLLTLRYSGESPTVLKGVWFASLRAPNAGRIEITIK